MKGKKYLLALLSVLMMASVGVACGEDTPDDGGSSSSTQKEKVTITLNETEASIYVFETLQLKASVTGSKDAVEWSSSSNKIATVSDDGLVTPKKAGFVIITASVGGEEVDCEIIISDIEGDIELETPQTNLTLETGTSKNLSVVGYIGVVELTDGEFMYESADEDIVMVDEDGTVTALKAGETTITVNAIFNGNEAKELTINVSVVDIVREELNTTLQFYANRMSSVTLNLKDYEFESIEKVAIGGKNYEFTEDGKKVSITKSALSGVADGENEIVISGTTEEGAIEISGKIFCVDYAIGTVEELNAFGDACEVHTPNLYAILTSNIDYAGNSFTSHFSAAGVFSGTLDGQGYSISNVTVTHSIFPIVKSATIKNIAFVNIDKNTPNGGGVLANELSNSVVDNVYIYGRVTTHTVACGSVYGYGVNNTLKNSLFYIDFASNAGKTPVLSPNVQGKETLFENIYAISTNSNGQLYAGTTPTIENTTLYKSLDEFKTQVTSVPEGFNPDYWVMEDGMLRMSAPGVDLPEIVIAGEQIVANNKAQSLVLDLSDYDVEELTSVSIGGYTVLDYDYSNNKLMVAFDKIPAKGQVEVSIVTEDKKIKANAYVVDYAIGTVAEWNSFADACQAKTPNLYAILTADIDYGGASFADHLNGSGLYSAYLDGQGHKVSNIKVVHSIFPVVNGESEAKPAVIKNIAFVNVEKNTANGGGLLANELVNAVIDNVYVQGKVTAYMGTATGALANYTGTKGSVIVKNSIFVIDYQSNPNKEGALVDLTQGIVTFDNVHVISTNSNGKLFDTQGSGVVLTDTKLYTSVEDFKSQIASVPGGFNPAYWEMSNGELVFKGI